MRKFEFTLEDYEINYNGGDLKMWDAFTVKQEGEKDESKIIGITFDLFLDANYIGLQNDWFMLDSRRCDLGSWWEWDLDKAVIDLDKIEYTDVDNNPITAEDAAEKLNCTKEEIQEWVLSVKDWKNNHKDKNSLYNFVDHQIEEFTQNYEPDEVSGEDLEEYYGELRFERERDQRLEEKEKEGK